MTNDQNYNYLQQNKQRAYHAMTLAFMVTSNFKLATVKIAKQFHEVSPPKKKHELWPIMALPLLVSSNIESSNQQ